VFGLLAQSPATFIALSLVLGLLLGSFLNVVIWRLPKMLERQWREQCAELANDDAQATTVVAPNAHHQAGSSHAEPAYNLIVPRSACPHCRAPIKAHQNIPVLSWLLLRGRCANCSAAISARYPLIELLCGLLTALVAWRFGFGLPALFAMAVTWFLIALTFIDLDHQLLPDALTLPLLWFGLLASLGGVMAAGTSLPVTPRSAIIGAAAGYLSLWTVYHLFRLATGKEGMGYGDFKLLAALGAWMGWKMLLPIILISSIVGAIVGIALIMLARRGREIPIPFGPYLAAAGLIALVYGDALARFLPF